MSGIPGTKWICLWLTQSVVSGLNLRQYAARLLYQRQCSIWKSSAGGNTIKPRVIQAIHAICISSDSKRAPSMYHPLDHPEQPAPHSHYSSHCAANSRLRFQARPTRLSLLQKDRQWNTPGLIQGQSCRDLKLTTHLYRNEWRYTSAPPVCFHDMYKGNYTLFSSRDSHWWKRHGVWWCHRYGRTDWLYLQIIRKKKLGIFHETSVLRSMNNVILTKIRVTNVGAFSMQCTCAILWSVTCLDLPF